jgi:hypothetical protein
MDDGSDSSDTPPENNRSKKEVRKIRNEMKILKEMQLKILKFKNALKDC